MLLWIRPKIQKMLLTKEKTVTATKTEATMIIILIFILLYLTWLDLILSKYIKLIRIEDHSYLMVESIHFKLFPIEWEFSSDPDFITFFNILWDATDFYMFGFVTLPFIYQYFLHSNGSSLHWDFICSLVCPSAYFYIRYNTLPDIGFFLCVNTRFFASFDVKSLFFHKSLTIVTTLPLVHLGCYEDNLV